MAGWPTLRRTAFAVFLLLTTGCWFVISHPLDPSSGRDSAPNVFPLRFKMHAFAAYCYNTLTCSIIYNNYRFERLFMNKPSGPPPSPNYREHWPLPSHLGIQNFPSPAEVRWRSLDGVAHEANVDMAAIFKDERVLYRLADSEIPDGLFPQGLTDAGIILEVDDRTISVYMKAFMPAKTEQIPGNKNSDFREDVILAWTRAY